MVSVRAALLVIPMFLLLAGPAAAAGISGVLELHEPLEVRGDLTLASSNSGIDLTPTGASVDVPQLEWDAASRTTYRTEWIVAADHNASAPTYEADETALPSGRLTHIECDVRCSVLLYAVDDSGIISAAAELSGPLARSAEPITYWAEMPTRGDYTFFHQYPAGTSVVGTGSATPARGNVTATGKLFLFATDARLSILDADDTPRVIDLWDERAPVGGPVLGVVAMHVVSRFIVLELEAADYASALKAVTVIMPNPDVTVRGRIPTPDASGRLTTLDGTRVIDDAHVEISGAFNLSLTALDGRAGALPLSAPRSAQSSTIRGEADEVWLNGLLIAGPQNDIIIRTSLIASVLGVLVIAVRLAIPLYSRIPRDRALSNENRHALWRRITDEPGLSATELSRGPGPARAVVRHHLAMLTTHGFLLARTHGRSKRYYPAGALPDEQALAQRDTLSDSTRAAIANTILEARDPATQNDIARTTGLSRRLVSYHLARLERERLVEANGRWRRTYKATAQLGLVIRGDLETTRTEKV